MSSFFLQDIAKKNEYQGQQQPQQNDKETTSPNRLRKDATFTASLECALEAKMDLNIDWDHFAKIEEITREENLINHENHSLYVVGCDHAYPIHMEALSKEEHYEVPLFTKETIKPLATNGTTVMYQTYLGQLISGRITVTNYKLCFVPELGQSTTGRLNEHRFYIPLGMIGRIEKLGRYSTAGEYSYGLELHCKDLGVIRFIFATENHSRRELFNYLQQAAYPLSYNEQPFCYQFVNVFSKDGFGIYSAEKEFERQGALELGWRVSFENSDYSVCDTYPAVLCIPDNITNADLRTAAQFRSKNRVIALSWISKDTTASISRCSQPNVGMRGKRSNEDEDIIRQIMRANPNSKKLYIMDARPRLNAVANQAKGQGYESESNYENCELIFLNIGNIHVMRDSLKRLKDLCFPTIEETRWLSGVDNTGWLSHVRAVLVGALRIANIIHYEKNSVLVHCSDGWDRTSQLCSLSEIILDPYYRTVEGFICSIEKDWLSFGHKFSQRLGQGDRKHDDEQRSPVFVQFIDCVWQLQQQFPSAFEFNERFLLTILDHMYSLLFGTFLYNCEKQRVKENLKTTTESLWSYIYHDLKTFTNPLYSPPRTKEAERIYPVVSARAIKLWTSYYMRWVPHLKSPHSLVDHTAQLALICENIRSHIKEIHVRTVTPAEQ